MSRREEFSEYEEYCSNLFLNPQKKLRVSNAADNYNGATIESPISVIINVFQGGYQANQVGSFKSAIKKFQQSPKYKLDIRYYTCDHIKSLQLSEKQFVDLMLDCDIHFIITHIHQNMDRLGWNMVTLYEQIQRLQAHKGFPSGPELECPMFTQNKIEYLRCLIPVHQANPTLKISFNDSSNFENYREQIASFVKQYKDQEGCGFVLKLPFVTNQKNMYFTKETEINSYTDQIIYKLPKHNIVNYGKKPYIMLQPTMKNRKEYKVATFDGEAQYVCSEMRKAKPSKAFSEFPHTELFAFAESAISTLTQANPSAITKGAYIRVDIFQDNLGRMVVNEFESLEGLYYCGDRNGIVKENEISNKIKRFYRNILLKYLEI